MCLFVCIVDHSVNEGETVDEQYCEQVNKDQIHDPEPEGQDLPEGYEDGKFNPAFDACFCPSFYKHNLLACFRRLHMLLPAAKIRLDSHPLICYNHHLTT